MTRKITMRLRPEDLKDNPALLAVVELALNAQTTPRAKVDLEIAHESELRESDPITAERALTAAEHALAEQRFRAAAAAECASSATTTQPSAEAVLEAAKNETDRTIGMLMRRGVAVVARIAEFVGTVGGPWVG